MEADREERLGGMGLVASRGGPGGAVQSSEEARGGGGMAQRKRVGGVERIANLWHLLTEARGTVGTGAQAEVLLTKWAGNEAGRFLHRSRGNIW